ncbi:MAG: glycosyltransferase family 1 protein [Bacteroidota bacterium]
MSLRGTTKRLAIAYDAKRVFFNFTGLGNYSRTLLEDLRMYQPQLDLHLFTPEARLSERVNSFLKESDFHIHEPKVGGGSFWRTFLQAREVERKGLKIYHGLSQELPLGLRKRGIRQIVTVHDVIFRKFPKLYAPIDRNIYNRKLRYACKEADQIIAISQATKEDIVEIYGIPPEKVSVIYQSCDPRFLIQQSPEELESCLNRYQIDRPFILSVGSIIKRKRLKTVIEGMGELSQEMRPLLIVIGKGGTYVKEVQEKIRELGLEKDVRFFKDIPFDDLPALYQLALFSVYPSIYEGFGIPVLESIQSGTPALISNLSSLPEAGGKGAHYLEEVNKEEMARGMDKLLTDDQYRNGLALSGLEHAKKFENRHVSQLLADFYASNG